MASIGDLVVNLSANTKKFDAGIQQSKAVVQKFSASAMAGLTVVTGGIAAVGAAALGAGMAVYGLTSRIDALDKIAKTAIKTGVSGSFLQQLEFAADQSGVSVDQVTAAIKKLTIIVGQGTTDISSLGISMEDLQRLSPEQQFLKLAEQISKLPTAAARAAAAVKVFGKSGIEMIPLFTDGMQGIVGLMEKARSLGIGIDEAGLAKVQEANDALGQMKAAFTAMIDQAVVGLAPSFTLVANKAAEMIVPISRSLERLNAMPDKLKFIGDVMSATFDFAFQTIGANWDKMLAEMVDAAIDKMLLISKLTNPVTAAFEVANIVQNAGNAGNDRATNLSDAESKLQKLLDQIKPDGKRADGIAPGEVKSPQERIDAAMKASDVAAADMARAMDMIKAAGKVRDSLPLSDPGRTETSRIFDEQSIKFDEALGRSKKANTEAEAAIKERDEANKVPSQKKFESGISSFFESLQGPIAEAQMGAQGMFDRTKLKAGAAMGTFENIFGGEKKKPEPKVEPRLAGAMQKGSSEAFSTIVQSMIRGGKDPVVKATEKQTKELVAKLKPPKAQMAFVMGPVGG